jgi:predicted AlkP superfamily phosphohydrolase/phosphomutase
MGSFLRSTRVVAFPPLVSRVAAGTAVAALVAALGLAACSGRGERAAPPGQPSPVAPSAARGRLVVLGFDGVDPRWLERWAAAGKLPHLAKLMKASAGAQYRRLASTNPPQSPVAWTTFATGTPPGDHGIFDFIGRRVSTATTGLPVLPFQGTSSFEVQASGPPVARNLRSGEPFWKTLADDGVRTVALNVPYSFPPDPMRAGRMLSGLGVPDLRETNSTFSYAGTDVADGERNVGGGVMTHLDVVGGVARYALAGPMIPGSTPPRRMTLPVEIRSRAGEGGAPDALLVKLDGRDHVLPVREESGFVELTFRHEGVEVQGLVRMIALEARPGMRLFFTPISFHPRRQYAPFTYPQSFAGELVTDVDGFYKTVGWDHDTSALNEEVVDEALWLREMDQIERQRQQMLFARLGRDDWDMMLWVSTATDRAAHMFYRLIDPEHPRYDAALAQQHGDAIERQYVRMDETVGRVLAALRPDDTLLVISDHGFHNYRRGLHVNQWLRQNGFLALRNDVESSDRDFLLDVEWSRTQAYALGTGQVYLNLRGRERDGIVNASDVAAVCARIRSGLEALRDTERGNAVVVRRVYEGRTVFTGGRAADAPDLQLAFAENYRTSWESILGGVPAGLFADNPKKWSGDHAASDVAETPGILVANRPIVRDDPGIVDLAPTALRFFGKAPPAHYTGRSVLAR